MLYLLIGFIVLVIILFSAGYFLKKKHYTRINELEEQKIELRDRPVISELSKVKKLKLTGETEKLFESWRSSWDEIETKLFPDVEEVILEAEMSTDRYKFRDATKSENDISQMLAIIERQINQILSGLSELLTSEERNAEESRLIKEQFSELKREVLARGFKLGDVLETVKHELDKITLEIDRYDELTDQGDHLEARELIIGVKKDVALISEQIERIPSLLHETEIVLPNELKQLQAGYDEMVHKGYYLEQLELSRELERMKAQIAKLRKNIHDRELDVAEVGKKELHTIINLFYDMLEQEVDAKAFVKENRSIIFDRLEAQTNVSSELAEQIAEVKQTYHISEEELAAYLKTSAMLSEQKENLNQLTTLLSNLEIAYSAARDTLKEINVTLDQVASSQDQLREDLRSLRKDELEAQNEAKRMRSEITKLNRKLSRARLPGLPEEYVSLRDHMETSIVALEERLSEKPLDMKAVTEKLRTAHEDLSHLVQRADEMVENARLVEHVVQYANRYRLQNPELKAELDKAESHFYRDFNYKKALEIAVTALEKVEAGAFKKIEKMYAAEISTEESMA
ncbi:septation ring formation regulator EzrA [Listeria sp. PSOL-1]|uniref:septation ring formation regulator EzrA n=1 Tax=Listeria sp. PSOL-1 TaxID=1844999 RepID=UPI0013D0D98B|nr:septation ring formation regulator EzrA [Listeria sp. PSOL-1]